MSTDVAVTGTGYSYRDDKLLDLLASGKSPDEIASSVSMTPAQVIQRGKHLLATRDGLSEYEQKQLLLRRAQRFLSDMEETSLDDTKNMTAYTNMIKLVSELVDKLGVISERETKLLNETQTRAIIGAIERAFYSLSSYIKSNHPEVNVNHLNAVFREAVKEGLIDNNDPE